MPTSTNRNQQQAQWSSNTRSKRRILVACGLALLFGIILSLVGLQTSSSTSAVFGSSYYYSYYYYDGGGGAENNNLRTVPHAGAATTTSSLSSSVPTATTTTITPEQTKEKYEKTDYEEQRQNVVAVRIMSFPNSGASYTAKTLSELLITNSSSSSSNMMHYNIQTKHCTGFCINNIDCDDDNDSSSYYEAFRNSCGDDVMAGDSNNNNQKVIVMIRNPFDVIASRLKSSINSLKTSEPFATKTTKFTDPKRGFVTTDGFKAWCNSIDRPIYEKHNNNIRELFPNILTAEDELLSDELLRNNIPCLSEWIRYITWYNNLFRMLDDDETSNKKEYHIMYYEDYGIDTTTIQHVLDYLDYSPASSLSSSEMELPIPFVHGLTYEYLYDSTTKAAIAHLVRANAIPKTWQVLRTYMHRWLLSTTTAATATATVAAASNNNNNEKKHNDEPPTKLVWLMSFPNSGTSYTMENTLKISNASTASNYGLEALNFAGTMEPIYSDKPYGPFWLAPHYNSQSSAPYVLTKTHCTGFCDGCKTLDTFTSVDFFIRGCQEVTTGKWPALNKVVNQSYKPQKAVHLIRNPLDNLVARMHLGVKRRAEMGIMNDTSAFRDSRDGLLMWCSYIDSNFKATGYTKDWLQYTDIAQSIFDEVPCYSDLFRYVQWHNNAIETIERLQLPVHVLYYEDYTSRYDAAVQELNDFLELPIVNEPAPFQKGKTYPIVYSPEENIAAARLVKFLATPKCWHLLQKYFVGHKFDGAFPDPDPNEHLVVWLMAFPGSGSSLVLDNVQRLTNTTTATNIGDETKNNTRFYLHDKSWDDGPFLLKPELQKPQYVLTKTYCGGYCDSCNHSASQKTVDQFEAGCRSTTRLEKNGGGGGEATGTRINSQYDITRAVKMVQLVRSPLDVIVARMHQGILKRKHQGWSQDVLNQFNDTQAGLLAWCAHEDSQFVKKPGDETTGDEDLISEKFPCYSEFFRYVQWQDNAIAMSRRLPIPSETIYYEDLTSENQHKLTTQKLLEFLEMEQLSQTNHDSTAATAGKKSLKTQSFYSHSHRRQIAHYVKSVASATCWELLRRYFLDDNRVTEEHIGSSIYDGVTSS